MNLPEIPTSYMIQEGHAAMRISKYEICAGDVYRAMVEAFKRETTASTPGRPVEGRGAGGQLP